jgi:hypothetical protein
MIRPEHHGALRPYLLPGERLLWTGRPKRGLLLRAADLYLIPFSLVVLGLGLLWVRQLSRFGRPDAMFLLFGGLFLAGAAYGAAGRFLVDALVRARLLYAVTDRRVLILRTGQWPRCRSLDLRHLPMLELSAGTGGRGTISFDVPSAPGFWTRSHQPEWTPALARVPRFLAIDNAAQTYDLIARQSERLRREALAALPPEQRAFIG